MKTFKFTNLLDAWVFCRKNNIKKKPKRLSLYEWEVVTK
jgi:hypothetical protein